MHDTVDGTGPTRRLLPWLLICLLAPAAAAFAQENPPRPAFTLPKDNPLSAWNKYMCGQLKAILLRSADKMPEGDYGFKPTEAVRSYGQIVGHVADAQYTFCSVALGEENPAPHIEQSRTSKADLTAALKDAFAYCDKAYDGMTDASAAQAMKLFGSETPKLGVLVVNNTHLVEHYGNLVTYMRLKNIVPPSSEPGVMPETKK
ncbi:MAG TPA: DinB family protein [Thermoanaerobaculia bacterium]|nr:DinB family protein [Thermoanaerobaculia bacterium]